MSSYLLIALFAALPAADAPKADADKIQGTWDVVRVELNGKAQPKNTIFPVNVTFVGDKALTKVGKNKPEPKGTFKLDPRQTPKTYEATPPKDRKSWASTRSRATH